MRKKHCVSEHFLNFLPFIRNMFSFSFLFILLFIETNRTNQFFINFDKILSFFIISKILFLIIFPICSYCSYDGYQSHTKINQDSESVNKNSTLIALEK